MSLHHLHTASKKGGIYSLTTTCQHYDWGLPSSVSLVSALSSSQTNTPLSSSDEAKPWAEMWCGTHPSGPSLLKNDTQTLEALIQSDPITHLGPKCPTLPYLLKILSIHKPLSIQSHPDKTLASKLFAENPTVYKDCNHKPEMAIALTDFKAMVGFRPISEILLNIDEYPEFKEVLNGNDVEALRSANEKVGGVISFDSTLKSHLKKIFTTYMTAADTPSGKVTIQALITRLSSLSEAKLTSLDKLLLHFHSTFPLDSGIFSPLFLNVINLSPSQSLFIPSNTPHAYISGQVIECMSCSDNVLRCGLTPKFKDVNVLCDSLTYDTRVPDAKDGEVEGEGERVYRPPVEDFEVRVIDVVKGSKYKADGFESAAILLILSGSGRIRIVNNDNESEEKCEAIEIKLGSCLFVSYGVEAEIFNEGEEEMKVVRAMGNTVAIN